MCLYSSSETVTPGDLGINSKVTARGTDTWTLYVLQLIIWKPPVQAVISDLASVERSIRNG